jgi:Skp family chaperone for outer membrane proteins
VGGWQIKLEIGERTVKRNKVVLATLATLGVAAYLASEVGAQTPGTSPAPAAAAAPASVKIGLVNLAYVFKGYNKYKVYSEEMDKIRLQYEKKHNDLQKYIKDCQDFATSPKSTQAEKEKMEEYVKTAKRQMEDNIDQAKKAASKKADEHMVQCYKEIEEAVKRYAGANGFHMILNYSEALTDADKYSPADVQRKISGPFNSAGVCPLYMVNGMDVSADVVNTLNTMFPAPAAAPATAPATGGGQQN